VGERLDQRNFTTRRRHTGLDSDLTVWSACETGLGKEARFYWAPFVRYGD
jgi:hypothetical protein